MASKAVGTARKRLLMTTCGAGLSCAVSAAQPEPPEEEHFFLGEQLSYDDNLFRIPDSDVGTIVPDTDAARDDYINRISLGIGDDVRFGRQTLRFRGRGHDVRFQENEHLDHIAADGRLALEWRLLRAWSGTLSADYNRALADFGNAPGTQKDLVDTIAYGAAFRYDLGPRWSLLANGRQQRSEHSLDDRRSENFKADTGQFGIEYVTPSEHSFGLEYRTTEARFPDAPDALPEPRLADYTENAALAKFVYTASVHTRFDAAFGYVERKRDGGQGEYSGDTWRARIDWKPREKFSTTLRAWHELKAYVDAESDYFVADGIGLASSWQPRRTLALSLDLAYEEQDYIGLLLPAIDTAREDEVLSGVATATYSPRENLQFGLSYRVEDRSSNRADRGYDAAIAALTIRWRVL